MRTVPRLLIAVALSCLIWLLLACSPASAQQPGPGQQDSGQQGYMYIPLENQTTTYTWLGAGVMLAGTLVIAFKKPKRAASR